jgi:flagellar motor switch protein FliG
VSNILAAADTPTNQVIRRNLVRHDAELARSLAQTPFLFSDLALLDDASLWTLLSVAEPDWVLLALIGAQPDLAERVASLLPPDEETDFRQALEKLGPTRLSDVEEAQYRIADLGRRLELEGEIHRANWRLGTVEV